LGWTAETLRWKVVEVWNLSAEELLTAPLVGVVPLVTLARYDGPTEVLLQRCRDRIEHEGGQQKGNLLAVAHVFARLHYDKPEWLDILGGSKMIIETPFIQQIVAESERAGLVEGILHMLKKKFGDPGPEIAASLAQVKGKEAILDLVVRAGNCTSLQEFKEALQKELPAPQPASTRGKRRSRKPPA